MKDRTVERVAQAIYVQLPELLGRIWGQPIEKPWSCASEAYRARCREAAESAIELIDRNARGGEAV